MMTEDYFDDEPSAVDGQRPADDQFEEPLASLAREYHAPGDVPVEAMWSGVAGRTRRAGRAGGAGEGRVLVFRRALRVALPIAAVLVGGILIGRMTMGGGQQPMVDGQRSTVNGIGASDVIARPRDDQGNPVAVTTDTGDAIAVSNPAGIRRDDQAVVDRRPLTVDPQTSSVFAVAAERHLAQSEAFLTLFRASVREGKDATLAPATARELLVNNRLLMDSPAANDPKISHLLDDIELVLAQIAQLPAEGREADVQIITDGLDAGGVLTRIRSEVTSGPVAAVPQGAL
jgi:hypothetical protein